jgi:hypothetical protein
MADTEIQAARRRGANLQRRRSTSSGSYASGKSAFHDAGPVHIAPPNVKAWQPLCGEPLGAGRTFTTGITTANAPLCPKCQEIEKAGVS